MRDKSNGDDQTPALRRTPLYALHKELGAKFASKLDDGPHKVPPRWMSYACSIVGPCAFLKCRFAGGFSNSVCVMCTMLSMLCAIAVWII